MIGRTNVGGGAGLNFKVVGGASAPASPKENTIWVNTDAEIKNWVFSAKRPIDIVDSYFVSDNRNQYTTALMVEADLKPDTTYTMTFEGVAGQKFYVNENFAGYKVTTVTSGRNTVTFTTNSELSAASANQYIAGYGWVVLKNHNTQTSAPVFTKLRIVEGDKDIDPSGMVWFSVGTASPAEFNALKKNSIQVCPLSAKQYVGGAWVDKIAKSYQGGAWADWVTYLFANGDECDRVTGGWYIARNTDSSSATYSNSNGHLNLKLTTSYNLTVSTTNKIDLTDADTIVVKATTATGSIHNMMVTDNVGSTSSSLVTANIASGENKIDVSQVTGSHYVAFVISAAELSVSEVHLA